MNDCDNETQVCIDNPPPLKWKCIQRTPAPTPLPTPIPFLCMNDKTGDAKDIGCTDLEPICVADQGKGGYICSFCINDKIGDAKDNGCTDLKPICVADQGKGGKICSFCINDKIESGDTGCALLGFCVNQDETTPPIERDWK
jgi:hypothetical protein